MNNFLIRLIENPLENPFLWYVILFFPMLFLIIVSIYGIMGAK